MNRSSSAKNIISSRTKPSVFSDFSNAQHSVKNRNDPVKVERFRQKHERELSALRSVGQTKKNAHHAISSSAKRSVENASDISPLLNRYAGFANASYKTSSADRMQAVDDVLGVGHGYQIDDKFTSKTHTLFYNPETKHVVTSFRGTKDLGDLSSDLSIATGGLNARFLVENAYYNRVLQKYNPDEYLHSVSGHSLGGSVANHIHKKHHTDIQGGTFMYNQGAGLGDILDRVLSPNAKKNKNLFSFNSTGDPSDIISLARGNSAHDFSIQKNADVSHSLQNFL